MGFPSSTPGFAGRYSARASRRFEWWYDTLIDWMLSNPGRTFREMGTVFGKSPSTLSLIVRSDLFQARLAQRRAAMMRELQSRLIDQTTGVAGKALALVSEKLSLNAPRISVVDAMEIADRAMTRLGYGAESAPNTNVSVSLSVDPSVLREAQARLRAAEKTYSAPSSRTPDGLAKNLLGGPVAAGDSPSPRVSFSMPSAPEFD